IAGNMPSAWEPSTLRDLHLQRKMARDKATCRQVPRIESARQAVAQFFEINVKEMVKFLKERKPLGDIVAGTHDLNFDNISYSIPI
ncbi:hypothetical protein Tco_0043292, partial [Tanacetum coccineum]